MVDLTAKPFHLDEDAVALGARDDRVTDPRGEGRAALHQSERLVRRAVPRQRHRPLPRRRDALPGRRFRRDPGAHPLRAVAVEGAAAGGVEPRDGRVRQLRRRHAGEYAPAGGLAPGCHDRVPHGSGRGPRDRGARLQLGVRPDRRHPPELAQHRCCDAELRRRCRPRHRAREAVLRRHQRVPDRVRDQALPRRRRRRAGSARRHQPQHPRGRGVARDVRQGLPGVDRPWRAVDHGRSYRRARTLAGAATRHPR